MLKAYKLALAALIFFPTSAARSAAGEVRRSIELTRGWRFIQSDTVVGAENPRYDDSAWKRVTVPHTWNRVGYYLPNPSRHINRADNVNKVEGVGWYRLSFRSPAAKGKEAWLEFDAASRIADVWLNGIRIGEHRGGFSRFRFDVTEALNRGKPNVLAVRVDDSRPEEGRATADVLPLSGDFFVHGGLYRPVRLILIDPVHIDMSDLGGPGIYAATTRLSGRDATVEVRSKLRNDTGRPLKIAIVSELVNRSGSVVARSARHLDLAARSQFETTARLHVADARLWNGVSDPYLYNLRAELRDGSGRLLDFLDQPFGIRTMRLDPQRGFFLNGKPVQLHGVGLHQDFEGKGWALSKSDVAETLKIIREMGANTVRLTHYQHDQITHDLADRYGLVLWDEIPLVSTWTLGEEQTQPTPGLVANARQQLQELIRQNYNHASVAVWSIANEVDFGSRLPGSSGKRRRVTPDPLPLLRQLSALAKAEDPTRPAVLANCCDELGSSDVPPVEDTVDATGANRYFGWYLGVPQDLDAHLDRLHSKRPWQPLAVSEYGAGAAITIHTDDPRGGPIDAGGRTQPEEYQSWLHEQSWPILERKPYLWATWLWNAFDFASTTRHEGDSQDINTKGLVTYDRKTRKDAFYFYKANWTDTPTVHINGRRYVDRAYPVTDVRIYSNAPSTSLRVNGVTIGTRKNCPERVCVWPGVRLSEGLNLLAARGDFGRRIIEDSIVWRLAPSSARSFRIDSGAIVAAKSQSGRFGSDAFFDGGRASSIDQKGRGTTPLRPTITGSPDRDLLASYRTGDFHYRIPAENGRYRVTLSFIEPSPAPTRRIFNVLANDRPLLTHFDILASAGAPLTLVQRSFDVSVSGGMLDLHFQRLEGDPIVSAVAVVPIIRP